MFRSKRKLSIIMGILIFTLFLSLATVVLYAQTVKPIELKVPHTMAVNHLRNTQLEFFKELIEEKTNGRIKVTIFPAGQLYTKDSEVIEALQMGSADVSAVGNGTLAQLNQAYNLENMPFLFSSREAIYKFQKSELGRELLDSLESYGLKGLTFLNAGSSIIFNKVRPITKPEDFKGLRFRVSAVGIKEDILEQFGAYGIYTSGGEVPGAVSQGMVDGVLTTPAFAMSIQAWTLAQYVTVDYQNFFFPTMVMSLKTWNKLPKDIQEIIENDVIPEVYEKARQISEEEEEIALAALEENGMQITKLNKEQVEVLYNSMKPIYETWIDKIGRKYIEGVLNMQQ